ncbi:hypothetical protein [Vibrio alginolyticus]|uniref:hypothetical protein n=1 Tax=Vibrio alginolyticus TaxID=663 RepID=UPI00211A8761|nr:hypothetical protein [Vibrio alginolyticus]MCQ9091277.1 hypothetical protein [Vibrio alginolyticus]
MEKPVSTDKGMKANPHQKTPPSVGQSFNVRGNIAKHLSENKKDELRTVTT